MKKNKIFLLWKKVEQYTKNSAMQIENKSGIYIISDARSGIDLARYVDHASDLRAKLLSHLCKTEGNIELKKYLASVISTIYYCEISCPEKRSEIVYYLYQQYAPKFNTHRPSTVELQPVNLPSMKVDILL